MADLSWDDVKKTYGYTDFQVSQAQKQGLTPQSVANDQNVSALSQLIYAQQGPRTESITQPGQSNQSGSRQISGISMDQATAMAKGIIGGGGGGGQQQPAADPNAVDMHNYLGDLGTFAMRQTMGSNQIPVVGLPQPQSGNLSKGGIADVPGATYSNPSQQALQKALFGGTGQGQISTQQPGIFAKAATPQPTQPWAVNPTQQATAAQPQQPTPFAQPPAAPTAQSAGIGLAGPPSAPTPNQLGSWTQMPNGQWSHPEGMISGQASAGMQPIQPMSLAGAPYGGQQLSAAQMGKPGTLQNPMGLTAPQIAQMAGISGQMQNPAMQGPGLNAQGLLAGVTPPPGAQGMGMPKRMAAGGPVPGQGRGDTVPAMLTPGEFVMNPRAVQNIGLDALMRANKGGVQHFEDGGPVNQGPELIGSYGSYDPVKAMISEEGAPRRGTRQQSSEQPAPIQNTAAASQRYSAAPQMTMRQHDALGTNMQQPQPSQAPPGGPPQSQPLAGYGGGYGGSVGQYVDQSALRAAMQAAQGGGGQTVGQYAGAYSPTVGDAGNWASSGFTGPGAVQGGMGGMGGAISGGIGAIGSALQQMFKGPPSWQPQRQAFGGPGSVPTYYTPNFQRQQNQG